jgi:hypothetical protein
MTPGIHNFLSQVAADLEIADYQSKQAAKRANEIVDRLKRNGWSVLKHQLVGSYGRRTIIRPLRVNNVDVMVDLDGTKYRRWQNPEGAHHIMDVLTEQLSALFKGVPVQQNGREIMLGFPEFRVDVIPALRFPTGAHLIPDASEDHWLYSDPVRLAEHVASADRRHKGNFTPLVRLVKLWNRKMGNLLEDFHIECMLINRHFGVGRLNGVIQSLAPAVCDFFLALPSMLETPTTEPIHSQRVDLYLGGKDGWLRLDETVDQAMGAAGRAGAALEMLLKEREADAAAYLGDLLGTPLLVPSPLRQRLTL